MRDLILDRLRSLEKEHRVRILFAVESGSRAWGFASPDSDYDVRFVFARHPHDILSVREPRDVIEDMNGDLDLSGWELKKALVLFLKTNPPFHEWLDSPIVYMDDGFFAPALRALAPGLFSPRACFHHYRAMAKNNARESLQSDVVRLKKYLYVLRPVLACEWILARKTMPPTSFQVLLVEQLQSGDVRTDVDRLLALKKVSGESASVDQLSALHRFLHDALARLGEAELPPAAGADGADTAPIDALLRETLQRAWPDSEDWN